MQQVQLDERLYEEAQRRASEAGFSSVDEYVADVVSHDLLEENREETSKPDRLFTAGRLAHIDQAEAEVKAGNFYTAEQADAELAKRRAEWLRFHAERECTSGFPARQWDKALLRFASG